jgi:hypothetical protein
MKIKLINKDDKSIITEYEADTAPYKLELVTFENKTLKVDQVEHFIRKNKMAQKNQIDYIGVTVKPVVTAI